MYAVFVDGSRQYRVSEGDLVKVDFREVKDGERVEFGRVILVKGDNEPAKIGQPVLEGARVIGDLAEQTSTKVMVQHFRRRKNYRRLRGHRQPFTLVKVAHILQAGQETPPPPPAPTPAPAATP
jgi:large subunit ribosomal protein L21